MASTVVAIVEEEFTQGQEVLLTAEPDSGSILLEWLGAPCGSSLTCLVTVETSLVVTARFEPEFPELSVVLSGTGEVGCSVSP